VVIIWCV